MAIQFKCSHCSNTLKVPDEHAGKSARCPSCQTVVPIPEKSTADNAIPFTSATDQGENEPLEKPSTMPPSDQTGFGAVENPYHAPAYAGVPQIAKGKTTARTVSFDEIFSFSWDLWKVHLGLLVGVTATIFGINFGLGFVSQIVVAIAANVDRDLAPLAAAGVNIVTNLVGLFLGIGQVRINMNLARTGNAEFGTLFSGADRFLPLLGASIIAGLALVVGFMLLIVPGIILALLFWGYYFQIIDCRSKAMESFSDAKEYCSINKGNAFVLWLASMGIMILGFLALCIGILFAAPLVSMMWTVAYLKMSGQNVER